MIIGAIVLLIVCFLIYNSLISKKNEIENAQGSLDAHLKQRYDLIPNLVSSVKAYMSHESQTLEKLVELRSLSMNKMEPEAKQELNRELSKGLSQIIVQAEQYPELKASASFVSLQSTLYEVEQNIAASRRFFNAAVVDYKNSLEMFPSSIFAKFMGLKRKEVFTIPEVERKNVSVSELFKAS